MDARDSAREAPLLSTCALLAALILGPGLASPAAAEEEGVSLPGGSRALLDERLDLYLEASPSRGQGWLGFVRTYCGTTHFYDEIKIVNGNRDLHVGGRYRIPFAYLLPQHQLAVTRVIFPEDRGIAEGWRHRVGKHHSEAPESLWRVAEWFTGRGDNYRVLREVNELADDHLEPEQVVLVPAKLLRPALLQVLPEASAYHLKYGEDAQGEFAIYRLKPGEALYSSVAARFAGLVFAEDVNQLAGELARRSGIEDVTDIPVGYEVKIPLDVLMPEFLPAGHPARREYEESLLASGRYSNQVEARRLAGVTVLLDAGHGGKDPGSTIQGVWESTYVYDIALRVKRFLEETTAAKVFMTVQSGDSFDVPERDRLDYARNHRVLTDPAYPIEDAPTGVNLRWYLVNSLYRRSVAQGGDPNKAVFLSIHADSLHPSLRGAMAYIPGARYRTGSFGKTGAVYASRREVREQPRVSFSRQALERSEGLSRQLAQDLIDAFAAADLEVHPDKPVRDRIVRSKRQAWVPAVLRYSEVPAQVLVEVCNLNNSQDRDLIQQRSFRQRVAEVTVQGILDYYDTSDDGGPSVAP